VRSERTYDLRRCESVQVTPSVCVGLAWSVRIAVARSSPTFLPAAVPIPVPGLLAEAWSAWTGSRSMTAVVPCCGLALWAACLAIGSSAGG